MRSFSLVLAWLATSTVFAQTLTLEPFVWESPLRIGTARGLRAVTGARVSIETTSAGAGRPLPAAFTPASAGNPAKVSLQLPRDMNGQRPHFELRGDAAAMPTFALEGGVRQVALAMPGFDAPATGDLSVPLVADDLCSVVLKVQSTSPTSVLSGLFVSLTSLGSDAIGVFGAAGAPIAGADPTGADGYALTIENGLPTVAAELLVPRLRQYALRGTLLIDGAPVDFVPVDPVGVNSRCELGAEVSDPTDPDPGGPLQVDPLPSGRIRGTVELRPEVDGPDAPRVESYVMQARELLKTGSQQVQNLAAVPGLPSGFDLAVGASAWLLEPLAILRWPDGRKELLDLPRGPAPGAWSPPFSGARGVQLDGSLVVSPGEIEDISYRADAAYLRGEFRLRGCVHAADIVGGTVVHEGLSTGPSVVVIDALGRTIQAAEGNAPALAHTELEPGTGRYEFVGTPGPWSEKSAVLTLRRVDASEGTGFSGEARAEWPRQPIRLVPGRANAVHATREVEFGSVTVALRVRNADGTFRPFRHPSATVVAVDAPLGSFQNPPQGLQTAMATTHHVRLLAPPGDWDIDAWAEIPMNPDGSGTIAPAPFPRLRGVHFDAPLADASCHATCLDAQTGAYVADDQRPPSFQLDAPPPPTTYDDRWYWSGRASDGSSIESVFVNGDEAVLSGGQFSGSSALTPGTNTLRLVVTDRCGTASSATYTVVRRVNLPPEFVSLGPWLVREGETLAVPAVATDPDGDVITYALEAAGWPGEAPTIDPATGLITWATDFASEGEWSGTVVAADGHAETRSAFTVRVLHVNAAPRIVTVNGVWAHGDGPVVIEGREDERLEAPIEVIEPDGDDCTFRFEATQGAPARSWAIGDSTLVWRPTFDDAGDYVTTIVVADLEGASDSVDVRFRIANVNRPPVIDPMPAAIAQEGGSLALELHATDPDRDELAFELSVDGGTPQGLRWAPSPGLVRIDWASIGYEAAGAYLLRAIVRDGRGGEASVEVPITVANTNRAPWFDPVPAQAPGGYPGSFTYAVHDADGDALACRAQGLSGGMRFDAETATVAWDSLSERGEFTVTVACSDGTDEATLEVPIATRWPFLTGGCECGSAGAGVPLAALVLLRRRRRATR